MEKYRYLPLSRKTLRIVASILSGIALAGCRISQPSADIPPSPIPPLSEFPTDDQCKNSQRDNLSPPVDVQEGQTVFNDDYWLVEDSGKLGLLTDVDIPAIPPGTPHVAQTTEQVRCIDPSRIAGGTDEQIAEQIDQLYPRIGGNIVIYRGENQPR